MRVIMKAVLENIEKEIKAKGWTKKEFAERLGESQVWLNNKLKGHRKVTLDDVARMVEELDISPSRLFTNNVSPDIEGMSFIDFMRAICKSEIDKYLTNHKDVVSQKK